MPVSARRNSACIGAGEQHVGGMNLSVYEMAHSPYCIPITRALTALGLQFERIPVPNWDRSGVVRASGGVYYQVPLLVNGDDVVFESSEKSLDVARYVDRTFAGGRLFPEAYTGIHEILVGYIEDDLEGFTFRLCDINYVPSIEDPVARAMVVRHKERRFGRGCLDAWKRDEAQYQEEAEDSLGRFDARLQHSRFLLTDAAPVYVDFALLGVIENYRYGGHHELAERHEALRDWRDRLLAFRFA